MKMHQVAASILCMALLLALCLSAAYSEEIIPFAESGNNVQAMAAILISEKHPFCRSLSQRAITTDTK